MAAKTHSGAVAGCDTRLPADLRSIIVIFIDGSRQRMKRGRVQGGKVYRIT